MKKSALLVLVLLVAACVRSTKPVVSGEQEGTYGAALGSDASVDDRPSAVYGSFVELSDGRRFNLITECVEDPLSNSEICDLPATIELARGASAPEVAVRQSSGKVCLTNEKTRRCVHVPPRSKSALSARKGALAELEKWERAYLPYSIETAAELDKVWSSRCTEWSIVREQRGIRLRQISADQEAIVDVSLSLRGVEVSYNSAAFRVQVCEDVGAKPQVLTDAISWGDGRFPVFRSAAACEHARASGVPMGCI